MKHPELLKTLSLVLAAASVTVMSPAAEGQVYGPGPRPGLEVFDSGTPVRQQPSGRYPEAVAELERATAAAAAAAEEGEEGSVSGRPMEGRRYDYMSEPVIAPQSQQPPYRAPDVRRPPVARPRAPENGEASLEGVDDPFANLDEGGGAFPPGRPMAPMAGPPVPPGPPPPPPGRFAPPPDEMPAAPYRPPVPPEFLAMENMNIANPYFPGLVDAVRVGSLPGASQIIWNTLRQRQMQGIYGFSTILDARRLQEAVMMTPPVADDPLVAAQRINVIVDAFQSPAINTPQLGSMMPQMLTRLNGDIFTVQQGLRNSPDEGVFLELARSYVRALTTCDFFAFSRRQIARDVRFITSRGSSMFYPDGSSRAGDVGGISGNLFHIMFMLDRYSQGDGWFKRDIGPVTRIMEGPGSFLSAVACPDGSLPNFGARGTRELMPLEVKVLEDTYPRIHERMYRIGLAGTRSYPYSSRDRNYGGVYVMRDNDGRNGRYLAMRAGALGDLPGVPAHFDFGTLVLMSNRVKYLADPGGYGGTASTPMVHGGLSLNGQYATQEAYPLPGEPSNAVWRTNASVDYLTASATFPDNKIWQRSVLYVKDLPGESKTDYWVVLDNVDMRDSPNPGKATIRFPLAPGVTAQREGPGVLMTGAGGNGTALRAYAVDAGVKFGVTDGGSAFDVAGGGARTPAVQIERELSGSGTTGTVFYPADDRSHRPLRIERDSDIIRGRTGVIVVDHGLDRMDVIAWAPPGTELVTPTLNLQMSADMGVFRIRGGRIARIDFVNLERFQAKEPDGGLWSMRVNGSAQSLTIERQFGGGWVVLSDPDNRGGANFEEVNFGPTVTGKRFSIRPGELRSVW